MNINDAFPSEYLKAADLTKATVFTIASVTIETLGEDKKPVLHFKGTDKALALNKTNAAIICEVLGTEETEDWVGKRISIYPTKTEYQGKRVPCLRVSDQAPGKAAPKAEESDEDTPF